MNCCARIVREHCRYAGHKDKNMKAQATIQSLLNAPAETDTISPEELDALVIGTDLESKAGPFAGMLVAAVGYRGILALRCFWERNDTIKARWTDGASKALGRLDRATADR